MGSIQAELTLGLMPNIIDDGETTFVKRLEHYVKSLEAERIKIEAFKRELPLCMSLLISGTLFISLSFSLSLSLSLRDTIYNEQEYELFVNLYNIRYSLIY